MPIEYRLNNVPVHIISHHGKWWEVFEPSQKLGHFGRFLTVRKDKLQKIEATNPLERLLKEQEKKQ